MADWTRLRDALDEVLVYQGLWVRDDGRVGTGARATTLSGAAQHANTVRAELRRRGTHPDVLRYCTDEILVKDNFHAMLEAAKSVFDKLRDRTGLTGDGAAHRRGAGPGQERDTAAGDQPPGHRDRTRRADRVGQHHQGLVRYVPHPGRPPPAADPHGHR